MELNNLYIFLWCKNIQTSSFINNMAKRKNRNAHLKLKVMPKKYVFSLIKTFLYEKKK